MVDRFDVFLVSLDPEPSTNAKNTRPCVVISPNEMNHNNPQPAVFLLAGLAICVNSERTGIPIRFNKFQLSEWFGRRAARRYSSET